MRVALDEQIFSLQPYGGISRLYFEVAREFLTDTSHGVEIHAMNCPVVNEYVLSDTHIAEMLGVRRAKNPYRALSRYFSRPPRRSSVEVFNSTFYLPRLVRDYPKAKHVVTVFDLIPELMPETRRRLDFLTRKRAYLRSADHIICISESTRRDLLRIYPEVKAPITIAYPGVSDIFRVRGPRRSDLPVPYILHVGNRSGYKDGMAVARAFSAIAKSFPDLTLLYVGGGLLRRSEVQFLRDLGITSRVRQVSLSDEEMPTVYQQAVITVYPSRYEGFGLPVVEAMAAGSPVLLSDTSSLPEVGGTAAQYFPPGDVDSLAGLMSDVLGDESQREQMTVAGHERSLMFTWGHYASSTLEAYKLAASG